MQTPPPLQCLPRYPLANTCVVGRYSRHVRLPQKCGRIDHVLDTGKDRGLHGECIDVGTAKVLFVTTACNKYLARRGCKYLEARLKYYSNLRQPKAEQWCCIADQIKSPEAREPKHRNDELIQTMINNNNLLFDIYYKAKLEEGLTPPLTKAGLEWARKNKASKTLKIRHVNRPPPKYGRGKAERKKGRGGD